MAAYSYDVEQLVSAIDSAAKATPSKATPEGVSIDFCSAWQAASFVLDILSKVPPIGIIAGIVKAAGEAYYKSKCKAK